MAEARIFSRRAQRQPRALLHRHSAPECDGLAPHGPRPEQHPAGHPHPLEAHERPARLLDARHRPCGHRHPERGGAPTRRRKSLARIPGTREIHRARLEVESRERRNHHTPASPPGRFVRLGARAVHDGREALPRRARSLREALRRGADLPRQLSGELVPEMRDGRLRPGSRARRSRRTPVEFSLSALGRRGRRHHCDDAPRDHARRYGRSRSPRR